MKMAPVVLSVGAVVLAGGLLLVSLWQQAEERVVPESLEAAEQAMIRVRGGEGGDDIVLPGDWKYWPKVVHEKVKLWLTRDEGDKTIMMIRMGGERAEMADRLTAEGNAVTAIKTINKGVRYLEIASELWASCEEEGNDSGLYWGKIYGETLKHSKVLDKVRAEIEELAPELVEDISRRLDRLEEEAEARLRAE